MIIPEILSPLRGSSEKASCSIQDTEEIVGLEEGTSIRVWCNSKGWSDRMIQSRLFEVDDLLPAR
jgi:hypothetical protein